MLGIFLAHVAMLIFCIARSVIHTSHKTFLINILHKLRLMKLIITGTVDTHEKYIIIVPPRDKLRPL